MISLPFRLRTMVVSILVVVTHTNPVGAGDSCPIDCDPPCSRPFYCHGVCGTYPDCREECLECPDAFICWTGFDSETCMASVSWNNGANWNNPDDPDFFPDTTCGQSQRENVDIHYNRIHALGNPNVNYNVAANGAFCFHDMRLESGVVNMDPVLVSLTIGGASNSL